MRKLLAALIVVLLSGALAALIGAGSDGNAAAAQYQYAKPSLTLAVINASGSNYVFRLDGAGYVGSQPGGDLNVACASKKAGCPPSTLAWSAGPVDANGSFSFEFGFDCGTNVKPAQAVDANGVKSKSVKGAC
jgi:hypothetical protein